MCEAASLSVFNQGKAGTPDRPAHSPFCKAFNNKRPLFAIALTDVWEDWNKRAQSTCLNPPFENRAFKVKA
ncbi:MAG: hypothetical protein DRR00_02650 [Candidatus Parabeggiatoa sp. nov. 3]|nr:MAG: hypothetical protein DRR00_02650 [Gammaproteobacteria bacterium]RKZ69212.1 MAG: hypothetical protein DRQ99_01470 [Gammaproteobacteria bacterium]